MPESYKLPKRTIPHASLSSIDDIVNQIIEDHYFKTASLDVRQFFLKNTYGARRMKTDIINYNKYKLAIGASNYFNHGTTDILIPTLQEYLAYYASINAYQDGIITIKTDEYLLDNAILKHDSDLERIAHGAVLTKVAEKAAEKIYVALSTLQIHRIDGPFTIVTPKISVSVQDEYAKDGIRLFQMEYLQKRWSDCTGVLDQETIIAMNKALNDKWTLTAVNISYLARTVYGEMRGENSLTKEAVAWTIRNRADQKRRTIREVVTSVAQYSAWLPDDPNYQAVMNPENHANESPLNMHAWEDCKRVAERVMHAAKTGDITNGCTHYQDGPAQKWATTAVSPNIIESKIVGANPRVHFYKGLNYGNMPRQ